MNPESVAIYSRGAIELPIGPIIIYNIASLLTPVFVKCFKENKFDEIVTTLRKEIKRIILVINPFFYTFLLLSEDFIVFLYTKEYLSSVPVFIVYLFILPVQIYAFDTILQAMKMTTTVFYISIASIASNIILSIVLIQTIGMTGAAIGTVFSIFTANYLYLLIINRQLSNPFKKWLPWKYILKINLVSLVLFALFYLISLQLSSIKPIIKIFGMGSSFFLCQIIVFWKMNILVPEDKKMIIEKALAIKKILFP
jgi:O-antigen/teichoic acid export membrane protein